MGNSDKEDRKSSKNTLDLSDLKFSEEERKDLIERFSFDECKKIKEVGELYRENSVEEIVSETEYDTEEVKQLIARYILLVKNPTDQATLLSVQYGIEYFGGQKDVKDISNSDPTGEVQEKIREYVGATLKDKNIDEVDLDEELPQEPVQPDSVREMMKNLKQIPRLDLPSSMLAGLSRDFSISQSEYNSIYQNILGGEQLEKLVNSTNLIGNVNVPQLFPSENVKKLFQQNQKRMQRLLKMGDLIEETLKPLRESFQKLQDHFLEVRNAVEEGISNFDGPNKYKPEEDYVNPLAMKAGRDWAYEFTHKIEEADSTKLKHYRGRIELALQNYEDGKSELPTFFFISMQDGLMSFLCRYIGRKSDATGGNYKKETKMEVLKDKYQDYFGIETGHFIQNLRSFYAHRNAIMHGDFTSYYDMNIATISLLFFDLTLFTVLKEIDLFD